MRIRVGGTTPPDVGRKERSRIMRRRGGSRSLHGWLFGAGAVAVWLPHFHPFESYAVINANISVLLRTRPKAPRFRALGGIPRFVSPYLVENSAFCFNWMWGGWNTDAVNLTN